MRRLAAVLGAWLLLALPVAPASGITGAAVPDHEHPFVGMLIGYDAAGVPVQSCSGSLLTPVVFLTAGHCTVDLESFRVYLQQAPLAQYDADLGRDPVTGWPVTCGPGTLGTLCATASTKSEFGYTGPMPLPDTMDVALVLLDQPVELPEYGSLVADGVLQELATRRGLQDQAITVSGYGLAYKSVPRTEWRRSRQMAESLLTNSDSWLAEYNVQTNGNGDGRGGTCNGDSGGPVFLGPTASNRIAAVTSFGASRYCHGSDYSYRVDRPAVQQWIRASVGEQEWSRIEVTGG